MLTVKQVQALKPKKQAYRVYDGDGNHFGVKVAPGGKKAYFQAYKSPVTGKTRFHNLGRVEDVALAEARERARQDRDLVQQGYDPQEVERQRIEEERRQAEAEKHGTVQDLVDAYVEHLREQSKSSWQEVRRALEREAIPVLGAGTLAREVPPRDIARACHNMIQRGVTTQANRLRSYLYSAFRFGLHHDNDPMRLGSGVQFGLESNPVDAVPRNPSFERARERVLSWDEVRFLYHYGDQSAAPLGVLYFRLALLTGGQRVAEYMRSEWQEWDLESGLWTIPAGHTKNRRIHVVPLTATALDVARALWAVTGGRDYVFASDRQYGPKDAQWPTRCAMRIHRRSDEVGYFRAADLRSTWKTLAGEAGISKEARDRVQNHALTDVSSQHYDRYDYLAEKRAALEAWEAALLDAVNKGIQDQQAGGP